MIDAEKVREALQAAYTPLADVDETVQTQVFDALDSLDSILTELADLRRDYEFDTHALVERAEKASAEAVTANGKWTEYWQRAKTAEARIQTLEAALRKLADDDIPWADGMKRIGYHSARDFQAYASQALAEDEA